MKRYVRASHAEDMAYWKAWTIYDVYDEYKNRSNMSIDAIRDEICKNYSVEIADGVCEMIDIDRGTIADDYLPKSSESEVDIDDYDYYDYDYNVAAYKSYDNGKLLKPVDGLDDLVLLNDLESVADKVIEYLNQRGVDIVSVNGQVDFDTNKSWTRDEIISRITEVL